MYIVLMLEVQTELISDIQLTLEPEQQEGDCWEVDEQIEPEDGQLNNSREDKELTYCDMLQWVRRQ